MQTKQQRAMMANMRGKGSVYPTPTGTHSIMYENEYKPKAQKGKIPKKIPDQKSNVKIRMKKSHEIPKTKITHPSHVADYVGNMLDRDREYAIVLYLDTKNKVIGMEESSKGSLSASIVHPREVFKGAMLANSSSVILVHNHPSGEPTPSQDDMALFERLEKAGDIVGVPCLDSIVVAGNEYYSIKHEEKGMRGT